MKRFGNLWSKFCSVENAVSAIEQGTENKRGDRDVIAAFAYSPEQIDAKPDLEHKIDHEKAAAYAKSLVSRIESGKWKPHKARYEKKWCKPGKWRDIYCPALEDHIVHWMLILVLQPAFMRGMYAHSCGSVPKRGCKHLIKHVSRWVQNDSESKYFVKLDIHHFFPSITKERLKASFRLLIKDQRLLVFIDMLIDASPCAAPIGFYTSPWFSNFFLQPFDHFVMQALFKTRRGKRIPYVRHYMRYADDMLLLGSSMRDLEKAVRAIIAELRDNYGLTIKPTWEIKRVGYHVQSEDGKRWKLSKGTCYVDYGGYKFARDCVILRDRNFFSCKRSAKKIYKRKTIKDEVRLHDAQGMVSKIGMTKHCNSRNFINKYINPYVKQKELREVISNAAKCGVFKQT